tara:strand:- start:362 stop:2827 length:2466 start_codon:yes stop_codon:yes gene_type:complete
MDKLLLLGRIKVTFFVAALSCAMQASPLWAQDSAREIEEVVVTARAKKDESVRDIPVAITAFTEEDLKNYGHTTLDDIAASSSSVDINRINSGSGVQISIRGVSSSPNTIGIESSSAVMIDGVYFPQARVVNEGLFDSSQIAILKGPQALYFGKNATSGAIVVTTNDPGEEFEVNTRVAHEFEYGQTTAELILSGPISENWGARLALETVSMDNGWVDNTAQATTYQTTDATTGNSNVHTLQAPSSPDMPAEERDAFRLTLKGDLNDRTTLTLKASGSKSDTQSMNEVYDCQTLNGNPHVNFGVDPDGDAAPIPASSAAECNIDGKRAYNRVPDRLVEVTPLVGMFGGDVGETYESSIFTANLDMEFDNFIFRGIANYHEQEVNWVIDCYYAGNAGCFAGEHNDFENTSFEGKLISTNDGAFNWALGAYVQRYKRFFRQEVIFAGAEESAAIDMYKYMAYDKRSETDGDSWSVYGEFIYDISDSWQLTAGGRWIEEEKDSYFIQPYVNPNWTGLFVPNRMLAKVQEYDDFVPEVTLRYQPSEDLTYYVSYREGWKSGGFDNGAIDSTLNADPLGDITYEPETVKGFEVGLKALLLDGSLEVNIEAYAYEYDDLQLNFFNNSTFAYVTLNAKSTDSEGFEIQMKYFPESISGMRLIGSFGYNDTVYTEFLGPCYGGQTNAQGCNFNLDKAIKSQQLGGTSKGLAPKNSANFGVDYTADISNGLQLVTAVNLLYRGSYGLNDYIPTARQKSYTNVDASVRLRSDSGWSVAMVGKNLGDEYIQTFAQDGPSTGGNTGTAKGFVGDRYAYMKPGRTLSLELAYEF